MINDLMSFEGLNVTINTTEDCNLRCKYCYEVCKNNRVKSIEFDKCKKFIDLIVEDKNREWRNTRDNRGGDFTGDRYIFDFIGGDSLMDVDLLEKVFRYIITKMSTLKTVNSYRFSISTNGTLFKIPKVRKFCEKWKSLLSLGVSIDGCPTIHDLNRVYPDGRGSMEDILKWWPWYQYNFRSDGITTKSTCNKDSIPYLYDSLVFMHERLGIDNVNQNFIMEDMHLTQEDLDELDRQMEKCVHYVADHQEELNWSMISLDHYPPYCVSDLDSAKCGSGRMPAMSVTGDIYPCFRWLPHTQMDGKGALCVGNCYEGLTHTENFIKVQLGSIRRNCTKDPKCLECELEPTCPYCIGGCYAEFGDFIRTTHICEVTKLQAKWTTYYWENLYKGDLKKIMDREIKKG